MKLPIVKLRHGKFKAGKANYVGSKTQGVGDQVKISGAYCCYVALGTAVLHGLGRMGAPVERDKADLGPVVV